MENKAKQKSLIAQLADVTKRDRVAQDLIGLGANAVPALIEALQTKDLSLFPIYEQILAHIPLSVHVPRIARIGYTPIVFDI